MTLQVDAQPGFTASRAEPVLYAVVEADGSIAALSPAASGRPAPRALHELVAPEDRQVVAALLAQAAPGQMETELAGDPRQARVSLSISAPMVGTAQVLRVAVAHDLEALRRGEELAEARYGVDPLTGLMTRGLLLARYPAFAAGVRRATGSLTAAVFLDVDGLKEVNDRHGHATGDAVLSALGERLSTLVRPGDLAARVGGDEMVVLLGGLPSATSIEAVVQRVERAMVTRRGLPPEAGAVSCSVGATDFHPDEALDCVLDRADAAMYLAKRARPGAVPRDVRCPTCSVGGGAR
jgi:diguanylate cyclase (GGDEF)-like protein